MLPVSRALPFLKQKAGPTSPDSSKRNPSCKLRGLATTLPPRSPLAPELPTIAESGLKDFEVKSWNGVVVPAGTPKEIIARLNGEIVRILRQSDLREKFMLQGVELTPTTPEEFGAYVRQDIAKWAKVIQLSGARPE